MERAQFAKGIAAWLATVACLVPLACGDATRVTASREPKACRPAPGPTPSQCRLTGADADWLPPAYVRNANCRCQATPSSPTANCVRGQLDAIVMEVPEATRDEWQRQKAALHDAGKADAYATWLRETAGPEIYRWHREAHAQCCCVAPLPPYERWVSSVTTPFEGCSREVALSSFGSCRGAVDRW